MKRQYLLIGLLLASAGCDRPNTSTQTTVEVPVAVEEVALSPIEETVVATGTVAATNDALMRSEAAGYYRLGINPRTRRPFALGETVKKNEVVVYLDNPEQENSIRIESQKLNLENTKSDYEKQLALFEKGGVTQSEIKTAERSLVEAQYSYDNALMQLEKLKVLAPFDGIITELPYYTPNVKVASGTDIVHVMQYSQLTMQVNIPGNLLGRVVQGQTVRLTNYAVPDSVLVGRISNVSPALDPDTRTFAADISTANPNLIIRPGMFVKAEIIVASKDSAIVIPKDIVMTRRNRKAIFVVERSAAVERTIMTGLENPREIEVIEGLEPGERLVIEGYETLRNGSRVRITR